MGFIALFLLLPVMSCANMRDDPEHRVITAVKTALNNKAQKLMATVNGSRVEVSVDKLPSALEFTPCQKALAVTIITGFEAGPQRIKVTCDKPRHWSVYIKGYIRIYAPVLINRHYLSKGTAIKVSDVVFSEKDISLLRRGYINTLKQVLNTEARRPLAAGKVLTPAMLRPAILIRRGDRIILVVKDKTIVISMPGEALEDGALNERIRVKNLSSRKVLQGRVLGKSEVNVW